MKWIGSYTTSICWLINGFRNFFGTTSKFKWLKVFPKWFKYKYTAKQNWCSSRGLEVLYRIICSFSLNVYLMCMPQKCCFSKLSTSWRKFWNKRTIPKHLTTTYTLQLTSKYAIWDFFCQSSRNKKVRFLVSWLVKLLGLLNQWFS